VRKAGEKKKRGRANQPKRRGRERRRGSLVCVNSPAFKRKRRKKKGKSLSIIWEGKREKGSPKSVSSPSKRKKKEGRPKPVCETHKKRKENSDSVKGKKRVAPTFLFLRRKGKEKHGAELSQFTLNLSIPGGKKGKYRSHTTVAVQGGKKEKKKKNGPKRKGGQHRACPLV